MRTIFVLLAATGLLTVASRAGVDTDGKIGQIVERYVEKGEALYRDLHTHPELSGQEVKTAAKMAARLREMGFEVVTGVGGHGVVSVLRNGEGPTVMLRTDMDALPVLEATGLPHASTTTCPDGKGGEQPVMHACGHDLHMAVWVGTLLTLTEMKDSWRGTLLAVAQPAEEVSKGALAMLRDGLFRRFPVPDYALAFHVNPDLEAGTVGFCHGAVFAGVSSVDIRISGQGGHGATPHQTVDPVVLAARTVLDIQTIVSRELDPLKPAVVTVGSIHGGSRHNIIPDFVDLQLTVRYFEDGVRERILQALERITRGLAISAGLDENRWPKVTELEGATPPLLNDASLVQRASASMGRVLGEGRIVPVAPATVGEDFGRYGRTPDKVRIAMFWLGAAAPAASGGHRPPLHNSAFAPAFAPVFRTGVKAMTAAVLDLLPTGR